MAELRHDAPLVVYHHQADHAPRPHGPVSHVGHVISFVTRGWCELEIGHPVRAAAGSLVILPAGTPHRTLTQHDFHCVGIGFCPSCLDLHGELPLMAPFQRVQRGAAPVLPVAEARQSRVQSAFDDLAEELSRSAPESRELALSHLRLLLGEACRAMPEAPADPAPATLAARALDWVQRHALTPISLRDVAGAVHCTPSHLATVVRRDTGHTVGQWIAAIRVSAAEDWLVHSDASMDEIAVKVGWGDTTHFIRQFKKATGQTPAAWRRAQRG